MAGKAIRDAKVGFCRHPCDPFWRLLPRELAFRKKLLPDDSNVVFPKNLLLHKANVVLDKNLLHQANVVLDKILLHKADVVLVEKHHLDKAHVTLDEELLLKKTSGYLRSPHI